MKNKIINDVLQAPNFNNKENELITTTDDRKLFHSRSVTIVVILSCIVNGIKKFAIEKRGPALDKSGLWCLPCGYLDWNENAAQAVKREVWEEIGLNLDKLTLQNKIDQPIYVNSNPDDKQNVSLRYVVTIIDNKYPKLIANNDCKLDEVTEAKWITIDELNNYEFAFEHNNLILKYFK